MTDAARTYRGRSSVAGYRGIAVGFPEKLNYAFNAETGTLSAIWRGDFVRVDRSGQGSGGFNPAGKFVALAQDVSFYALPDEQTAWPLRPVMTKEAPVNPDPLYPKNRGYQFKGYYMDDASVPTFMYRSGDIEIEDRSAAQVADKKPRLVRTLTFDSPRNQTVWFRALTGKIEAESKQQFKNVRAPAEHPAGADRTPADRGRSEVIGTVAQVRDSQGQIHDRPSPMKYSTIIRSAGACFCSRLARLSRRSPRPKTSAAAGAPKSASANTIRSSTSRSRRNW